MKRHEIVSIIWSSEYNRDCLIGKTTFGYAYRSKNTLLRAILNQNLARKTLFGDGKILMKSMRIEKDLGGRLYWKN